MITELRFVSSFCTYFVVYTPFLSICVYLSGIILVQHEDILEPCFRVEAVEPRDELIEGNSSATE